MRCRLLQVKYPTTTTGSTKRWYATPAKRQAGARIVVETLDANYLYRDPALGTLGLGVASGVHRLAFRKVPVPRADGLHRW
jgi:hypothetical protein